MQSSSATAARSSIRIPLSSVSDGRCAPIWIGTPGAARRAAPARSDAQSQPACRERGLLASVDFVGEIERSDGRVAGERAGAGLDEQRLRAQERRVGEEVARRAVGVEHPTRPPELAAHVDDDQRRHRWQADFARRCGRRRRARRPLASRPSAARAGSPRSARTSARPRSRAHECARARRGSRRDRARATCTSRTGAANSCNRARSSSRL